MRRAKVAAALAVGALTLSGCGFKGLYTAPLPGGADIGDHPFTITAYFDDVLDLVPQSSVKVNDVAVGKVTTIDLGDNKKKECGANATTFCAKVKMEVNDSVHLPDNATAEISQTSLLGEKYVALSPPQPEATPGYTLPVEQASAHFLHNGSVIQLDHTRSAAEVEQVLGALSLLLNEGGLRQIKVIGDELVSALKGREPDVRDLLGRLDTFVTTLDNQKDDIVNALVSVNKLAVTLNRNRQVLVDSLDLFPPALKILSDERGKLVKLLTSLDKLGVVATDVINATQQDFVTSLQALKPVLAQLRASGDDLPQSLRILGTFPFPLGNTRQLIRGDYANLDAYLNLDLSDTLCGLSGSARLCGALGNSKSAKKVSGTGSDTLKAGLIGAGG